MKDIMQKLAELEATAPKVTKKKMLNEDSTTPPINVSNKPASLKDMFEMLSENVAPGQKPLPVLDPQKKQAGMGFVTSDNPAVQNLLKNLDPKDVQIVQAPGQPGQPQVGQQQQQSGQPAQAGATGQQQMREKDEGKPGKNFAKIAKSAGKRYGSKEAGERVAGAVRAKLAKQGKLEEEQVDEISKKKAEKYINRTRKSLDDLRWKSYGDYNGEEDGWDDSSDDAIKAGEKHDKREKMLALARAKKNKSGETATHYTPHVKAKVRATEEIAEGAKVDRMVKHIEKVYEETDVIQARRIYNRAKKAHAAGEISHEKLKSLKSDLESAKSKAVNEAKGEAEKYRAQLLKTAPRVMDFLAKAVNGWRPSEQEMLGAIDTAYTVMKHTGDVKQAGKAMMDELNTLHRMSQGQSGMTTLEGKKKGYDEDSDLAELYEAELPKDPLARQLASLFDRGDFKSIDRITNSMAKSNKAWQKNKDAEDAKARVNRMRAARGLPLKEDADLVELSKQTVKKYEKAANADRDYHRSKLQGSPYDEPSPEEKKYREGEWDKRSKGLSLAYKKLAREEVELEEEQLDELSPELVKKARDKRYDQLSRQAGASTGTLADYAKPSGATVNKYWDTEARNTKERMAGKGMSMPNTGSSPMGYDRGKASPAAKTAYLQGSEMDQGAQYLDKIDRNKQRDLARGKMMGVAGKKLAGTANVPAKSVAEGAKVDRMVKHIEKSEKKLGKSKGEAEDIAWATANKRGMLDNKNKKKVKEGDIPSSRGVDTMGAGLGAGRSATTLESKEPQVEVIDNAFNRENYKDLIGKKYPKSKAPSYARVKEVTESKKPDFLDLDKDGNKKEPMKKAAADKKKKKVDESMNHRISAARLEGKSHGLRGHAHSGKRYEDLDEIRAYHEGYKEGLDECYGQGVYETAMPATVPGMASAAMEADLKVGMSDHLAAKKIADKIKGTPNLNINSIKSYVAKYIGMVGKAPTDVDYIATLVLDELENQGMMDEGNAFTKALADTEKGGEFSLGGKTYTDRTNYDANLGEYAFESLDKQLNALLNESEEVNEGLSVSISKGQQNSPDSVTITAQDQEAEHLLAFVKNAGLGLFGDDNADTHSSAMSIQPAHGAPDEVGAGGVDIGVVDGHDGMMGLMQKLSGVEASGAEDYADEEGDEEQLYGNHEEAHEETCNECGGMMEAGHSCGSKEMVDEVETEDQMEFEVAEDNAPDSDEAETSADENAEAEEDKALAGAASGDEEEIDEGFTFESIYKKFDTLAESKDDEDEDEDEDDDDYSHKFLGAAGQAKKSFGKEKVDEWANNAGKKGTDAAFEADIDFMTKVISGGLNKPKSTGQTTVPVIAGQDDRMHDNPMDWVKLAGIK